MSKTTATSTKGAVTKAAAAPAAASTGAAVRGPYKHPANHVGYITESKKGNNILKVEQDIELKAGDLLYLAPRDENSNQPEWKKYKVNKIVGKDEQ